MTLDPCQPPTPLELAHTAPWVPWLLGLLLTGGSIAVLVLLGLAVTHWRDYLRRRR